ncbi:hypothetical protein [Algoriphagus alkaliphilus]|uniref:hypothetical protein n=1 Tax=Algoriphagus alkaliphilus TaxID=279824 RepID=UPI00158761C3|nr:hypothetical protein [Algoriphagus alkaliphilus]
MSSNILGEFEVGGSFGNPECPAKAENTNPNDQSPEAEETFYIFQSPQTEAQIGFLFL